MQTVAVVVGSGVALGIFAMLGATLLLVTRGQQPRNDDTWKAEAVVLRAEIDRIDRALSELPMIYDRAAERAEEASEKAAKRLRSARAAESRVRRQSEGDLGDDDESEDPDVLRLHAGGGGAEGVHAVSDDVGVSAEDDLTQRALAAGWNPFL